MRLVWKSRALRQLDKAAEWSPKQARAVVDAMEQMGAERLVPGPPLGRPVGHGRRYMPVRPLGVFYRVIGDDLVVVSVVDARRLRVLPGPSAAGGAVIGEPRLTSAVHLDMVADRASRIAVMPWGDAALQSVPVAHDTNEVTVNEARRSSRLLLTFRAIAFVPHMVGVTFPVPIRP